MAMATTKAEQFMGSPLVIWLNTFDDINAVRNVHDLADGVLLHKVMYTIDPEKCSMTQVARSVSHDQGLRMQNLLLLVNRIRSFYLTNMQQLVIGSLPDIVSLCTAPESEYSLDQMEKLLILLLGCAVKSEPLVVKMKSMDPIQQKALVTNIKQVTHSTDLVCSIDWDDLNEVPKQALQGLCKTAYSHLLRVAKERDSQYDSIVEVSLEKDHYKQLHMSNTSFGQENGLLSRSPATPANAASHINPELLEMKKKIRHLQEQLDHKSDMVIDLKEELEQARIGIQKLQTDKRELAEQAKTARAYRDEIEMLKVQEAKVEKLEADVIKYKQKAEDTEYLKKKIKGMKAENELTVQTKSLLEQKIEALTYRSEALDDLQEDHASVKAQLESLQQEKEMDTEKIEELITRNAHLELEFKHYEERMAQMNLELEMSKANALETTVNADSNLSFEMSEADMASKVKVLRLEKEAREMEKTMESLRHAQAKSVELEKINKQLHTQAHKDRREIIKLREEVEVLKVKASRVDKLQVELNSQRERVEEAGRNASKLKDIKSKYDIILEGKATLEDEVDSLQSKVQTLDVLKDENASLKVQADSLVTDHKEDERRIQELLQQNAQLELEKQICSEEVETVKSQLTQLRSKGPHGPSTMFSPPRMSETEMASRAKLQRLEKETQEMEKTMEALRHTQAKCSEQEKINKKLTEQTHADKKEIIKLKEGLQSSKGKLEKMEKLQSEMKNQELQLEDADAAKRKITELKQQNALLTEAKLLLQEDVSGLHTKVEKYGLWQADQMALQVRVEAMEAELQEESLRMQELLQQNVQLELDRDMKNEELKAVNEELLQLKLGQPTPSAGASTISPVHKPMSEEDLSNRTKLLRMERDNRELERSLEVERETSVRKSAEMEKMNRKLTATIHADKKEIARLKEELRRERHSASASIRAKSVSDDTDYDQTRQVQELESKFKDAYSQSLSNKDERIQVLEKRVEETIRDNAHLREDLVAVRKQKEKLKESPRRSPATARGNGSSSGVDVGRLREKVAVLHEKNNQLATDLKEARRLVDKLESSHQVLSERIQMMERLTNTLEEEKTALRGQMNRLLEKNQELLVKTLETKDVAMEDERIFNDRLGELERDKIRLKEQLDTQRRDTFSKERAEYWKKTNKSKNLLKKGFKKLKGKIQQGKSYTFEYPDGGLGVSSHALGPMGSVGSIGSSNSGGNFGYHAHEGSMSSSQSVSSSNSKQSEEQDEEAAESVAPPSGESSAGPNLIPRPPTFENSPFLRPRKGRSINIPGVGPVKLRHGASHSYYGSGYSDPDKIPDDLMSLEDFLAESEKTPNRRRVMELNRASLIIGTPPSTPRNSLLLPTNSSQMFDLQEFLDAASSSPGVGVDPRSKRDTIHEEPESFDHLEKTPPEFKSSLRSVSQRSTASQHSRSSGSLHSTPSVTSVSRTQNSQDQVIANPAAVAGNLNNNSNNNNNNDSVVSSKDIVVLVDGTDGNVTSDNSKIKNTAASSTEVPRDRGDSQTKEDSLTAIINTELERRTTSKLVAHQRVLSQKTFHQSSGNVIGECGGASLSLPKKAMHRSATDVSHGGGSVAETKKSKKKGSSKPMNLAELTNLKQSKAVSSSVTVSTSSRIRLTRENRASSEQPRASPLITVTSIKRTVEPPASPRIPKQEQEQQQGQQQGQQRQQQTKQQGASSQDSDELMCWEDFLSGGTNDLHGGGGGGPPPVSPRSDGSDTIWLSYGKF